MAPWTNEAFAIGGHGVEVFFVLSGFVIAYSLRAFQFTGIEIASFAARRQVRLDPIYWFCILTVLLAALVESFVPGLVAEPFPGVATVVTNFFYVHRILGYPSLIGVSWTLCIEIQFYLVFVLMLAVAGLFANRKVNSGSGDSEIKPPGSIFAWFVAATGILSSAALFAAGPGEHHVWFVQPWAYFALGATVCWAYIGRTSSLQATVVATSLFAVAVISKHPEPIVGVLAATSIYLIGKRDALGSADCGRLLQFFGAISYSLYLTHELVLTYITKIGFKLGGRSFIPALTWIFVAATACVVVAVVAHRAIERPTMRLASRIRRVPSPSVGPTGFTASAAAGAVK